MAEQTKKKSALIILVIILGVAALAVGGWALYQYVIAPNMAYARAETLLQEQKFDEAYAAFDEIGDFRDCEERMTEVLSAKAAFVLQQHKDDLKKAQVGDTVYFGHYEQDNDLSNGDEEIEWQVLDRQGDNLMLFSSKVIDCQRYNEVYTSITWEWSDLRYWMNNSFLNRAFNDAEKAILVPTTHNNPDNQLHDTKGGNDTTDLVYPISTEEANRLFKENEERMAQPTAYALARGAYINSKGYGWCWTRTPGVYQYFTCIVRSNGIAEETGGYVCGVCGGVRPIVWVNTAK